MSALKYWIWLAELKGLRGQIRLALLDHFGSPENVYFADSGEILLTEGMTKEQASFFQQKDLSRADHILADCERLNFRILTIADAEYPDRLRNIYDPPCLLYCRGRLPPIDEEVSIAVVGTRTATPYGITQAERFGEELASGGSVVVTGLARGIDSVAAEGALRGGGKVIGVLGNGIDVVYPRENRYLYEDVAVSGVLLSEYAPGTKPAGSHFPVRNRIISGLSLATLVVEAPEKSGALITAGTALEQSRDVYAIPGAVDAEMSRGCNRLIREGAGLVTCGWDILQDYVDQFPGKLRESGRRNDTPENKGYQARQAAETPPKEMPEVLSISRDGAELTDDQISILKTLTDEPMLVDDLIEKTQIPARRILSALTMLELDNYVLQSAGKRYVRNVMLCE